MATSTPDILDFLADQGVTAVRRLNKGPEKVPTPPLVLSFSGVLPKSIKIGYAIVRVRPFYPRPFQCFKCYRFGHGVEWCRFLAAVCRNCGGQGHIGSHCGAASHCINCDGSHQAMSMDCPKFREEVSITKIKVDRGVSFLEAREVFDRAQCVSGVGGLSVGRATVEVGVIR